MDGSLAIITVTDAASFHHFWLLLATTGASVITLELQTHETTRNHHQSLHPNLSELRLLFAHPQHSDSMLRLGGEVDV